MNLNLLLGVRRRERRGVDLRRAASLAGPVSRLRVEETLGEPNGRSAAETYQGHRGCVNTLCFGAGTNSSLLLSGGDDCTIKIWNVATGVCVATLQGHGDKVRSLAVLEGGRLASGSADETIKIWEIATGACVATLHGHGDWVTSLAVLTGGRLASGSDDRTIKIWDHALGNVPR